MHRSGHGRGRAVGSGARQRAEQNTGHSHSVCSGSRAPAIESSLSWCGYGGICCSSSSRRLQRSARRANRAQTGLPRDPTATKVVSDRRLAMAAVLGCRSTKAPSTTGRASRCTRGSSGDDTKRNRKRPARVCGIIGSGKTPRLAQRVHQRGRRRGRRRGGRRGHRLGAAAPQPPQGPRAPRHGSQRHR